MIWSLLRRGLIVGALAGLLAGVFAFAVGEPPLQRAIDFEERTAAEAKPAAAAGAASSGGVEMAAAASEGPKAPPPVSRNGQRAGLLLATLLYGTLVGGLFALLYGVARSRTSSEASDWTLSTRLAAGLFGAVVLVPFLKYPPSPPSVGDPETIASRTALYLVVIAVSLLALLAAARAARTVGEAGAPWARPLVAALTFVGTTAVAMVLLPGVHEVPSGFPADVLWDFRVSSLGTQAVLWAALGMGFGVASHRTSDAGRRARGARAGRP